MTEKKSPPKVTKRTPPRATQKKPSAAKNPAPRPRKTSRDKRDPQALELWRGGASFDLIAKQLGFKDALAAETAAVRELEKSPAPSPEDMVRLEIHRLDVMQMSVWPKARRGDESAVETIMKIEKRRSQLRAISRVRSDLSLEDAVELSVDSSDVVDLAKDAALIVAAKKLATQIDRATETGADLEVGIKGMYLIPHLANLLKEMQATPASRRAVSQASKETSNGDRLIDFQAEARRLRGKPEAQASG